MVNINKLKGKIVENGLSVSELATLIGVDKSTLYRKFNSSGASLTIKDADKIASVLKLNRDEINAIFFSQLVS